MVAGVPGQGGWVWAVLQWVLGLRQLGHDVLLVEPIDRIELAGRATFTAVVEEFGLGGAAAMVTPAREAAGLDFGQIAERCRRADLLVNIAGVLRDAELLEPIPARAYVDVDPGFTQLWHQSEGIDMGLAGHTSHFTVGLNVGSANCPIPSCGVDWVPTLPPVVLERWPERSGLDHDGLTTVANWRGYGSVEHDGVFYGQKAHAWRELFPLARLSPRPCTPALAVHPDEKKDVAALAEHGWSLLDPAVVAGTPAAYQRFVSGSWGELSVAKSGYVVSRSGWFSDRSACYLAAGRPVVAQDTGFSDLLPVGEGLLAFDGVVDAVDAIAAVASDYKRHRRAARVFAEEHLDSRRVLGRLVALASEGDHP
jgi:hypothetical protein